MAITKAQQRATAKYVKKTYARLEAKVPIGQKDAILAHAEATDGSLSKFLKLWNGTGKRDNPKRLGFWGTGRQAQSHISVTLVTLVTLLLSQAKPARLYGFRGFVTLVTVCNKN